MFHLVDRLIFRNDVQLKTLDEQHRHSTAVVPRQVDDAASPNPDETEKDEENAVFLVSRKDSIYQGSLNNIKLFSEDPVQYRQQMIKTSRTNLDEKLEDNTNKKNLCLELTEQIDLKLLKNVAFFVFAVSNFLTSLGFNIPYTFANDLATDAKVQMERRHWAIMSIGVSNCFGRLIIGYLADKQWVSLIRSLIF